MAELLTKPTDANVEQFLKKIVDENRRQDCFTILRIMEQASHSAPVMWGTGIVGFGQYHFKYASGREGDWFLIGFSPRKQDLTIYLMAGLDGFAALLEKLGKHKRGKGCLYIKKLQDIDLLVLSELIGQSVKNLQELRRR